MSDDQNVDPRFDPAFQRGFEGTVGSTPRRPSVGTPSVLPAQQTIARPPVPSSAASRPEPESPRVTEAAAAAAAADVDAAAAEEPTRRVNPFVIALVVIAIALFAIGAWGAQYADSVYKSDTLSTQISYVTVLLVISGSAVSVGLGVATLVGIVFLFAARYRRS